MSVIAVGGERFAVGIEWEGELVQGRDASQLGWEHGRPWTVDVDGQTGFLDGEDAPGGVRPLAGALRQLWQGGAGRGETWIGAIEEDGGGEGRSEPRVAVVRCSGGVLLADGEELFETAGEAVEQLAQARAENVPMVVTAGLADRVPEAEVVTVEQIVGAAGGVAAIVELKAPGRRGQVAKLAGGLAAILVLGGGAAVYGPGLVELAWETWVAKKEQKAEPLPTVNVGIATPVFLESCREELGRRELRITGFDRVAVFCRSSFEPGQTNALRDLRGKPVLEARWRLREPLNPRVYGPLAERLLGRWHGGVVKNEGEAVAFSPLAAVLVEMEGLAEEPAGSFRARIDRAFALHGFRIDYQPWGAPVEVVLTTGRPFGEAVALVGAVEGLEVVQAVWAENLWRFEGRRPRPRNMLEREFEALEAPLTKRVQAAVGVGKERSGG